VEAVIAILNVHLWKNGTSLDADPVYRPSVLKFNHQVQYLSSLQIRPEDILPTLDILLESRSLARVDSKAASPSGTSSSWAKKLNAISLELCRVMSRLEEALPNGDLRIDGLQEMVPLEDISRAPTSKSSRDDSVQGSPTKKKQSTQVSNLVSHFTKINETSSPQVQKPSPIRRKMPKAEELTPSTVSSIDTQLQGFISNLLENKVGIGGASSGTKAVAVKSELGNLLRGVRYCMKHSEKYWESLESALRKSPIRLFNNLRFASIQTIAVYSNDKCACRLLVNSAPLDQNAFNKLGHALMIIIKSKNLDASGPAKPKNPLIQGFHQSIPSPALGSSSAAPKQIEHWQEFEHFISTKFHLKQKDLSTAKFVQSAGEFTDLVLSFSSPFGHRVNELLQGIQLGSPNLSTVISMQTYLEVNKTFAEVRSFMDKPGYFDHLRTTKLKAGHHVSSRVLETLELLFDWIKNVIDDAAMLYDQNALLSLMKEQAVTSLHVDVSPVNGMPVPYCNYNQSQMFLRAVEVIALLDKRTYLQSLSTRLSCLGNPANYSDNSLLCDLLAPPGWIDGNCTAKLSGLNHTLENLHRVISECVLSGIMSESDHIVTYLGICPFTSVSRVHFRALQRSICVLSDAAAKPGLIELAACLLIKNRVRLRMDVSKLDTSGRSALLSLCSLKYWKAAQLLVESTLTDPLNEAINLAIYPIICNEKQQDFLSMYMSHRVESMDSSLDRHLATDNMGGVMIVTPLHFAVVFNAQEFIKFYISACPNLTTDVSLFYLSVAANTAGTAGLCLMAKTSSLNADVPTCFAYPARTSTGLEHVCRQPLKNCRLVSAFKNRHDTAVGQLLKALGLVIEAFNVQRLKAEILVSVSPRDQMTLHEQTQLYKCDWESYASSSKLGKSFGSMTPLLEGTLQGLCVQAADNLELSGFSASLENIASLPRVMMMDGSSMQYSMFVKEVTSLIRAMPIPMYSCGTVGNGTTILHSIMSKSDGRTSGFRELLQALFDHGINRLLCSDNSGAIPVFNAFMKGNYSEGLQLLKRAADILDSCCSPDPLNCLDPRYFKGVVVRQTSLPVYPYIYRVFTEYAKKAIVDADAELNSKKQELFSAAPQEINVGLLVEMQGRTERLWKYICGCDFKELLNSSYNHPVGNVLHSVMCAKQILGLIGIPFSQIGIAGPGLSGKSVDEAMNTKFKLFETIGPASIKKAIPMAIAQELKALLLLWLRQRFQREAEREAHHYELEACTLLFHRHDISVKDVAENGLSLIRRKLLASSAQVGGQSGSNASRGYLYVNNCNEHLREIGANLGRKFVRQRILANLRPLNTSAIKGSTKLEVQLLSLPSQLQAEAQLAFSEVQRSLDLTIKPGQDSKTIEDNNNRAAFLTKELTSFIEGWNENTEAVLSALRLSYYLLDLARLLVSTRFITSMTHCEDVNSTEDPDKGVWSKECNVSSAPSPSQSPLRRSLSRIPSQLQIIGNKSLHPLDKAIATKAYAVEQYSRVCSLLGNEIASDQSSGKATVGAYEFGKGINTRLQIVDELTSDSMECFFKAKKELIGPTLTTLRCLVLEGLTAFLLAANRPKLCDFVCKMSRKYNSQQQIKAGMISAADREDSSQSVLGDDATEATAGLKKLSESTDDKRAFIDLVVCLQHLNIRDVLSLVFSYGDGSASNDGINATKLSSTSVGDLSARTRSVLSHCADMKRTSQSISTLLSDIVVLDIARRTNTVVNSPYTAEFMASLVNARFAEVEQYSQSSPEFVNEALINEPQSPGPISPKRTRAFLETAR
jgi:hypothetical protein